MGEAACDAARDFMLFMTFFSGGVGFLPGGVGCIPGVGEAACDALTLGLIWEDLFFPLELVVFLV